MTTDDIKEKVIHQEAVLHQVVETNKLIAEQVKATNEKVDKLAEVLAKHEVIQVELSHLGKRIGQLEQLRWWFGTLVVGAIITYVLKTVVFVGGQV